MDKYKVIIKKIDWLDKDNPEADVLFEIEQKQYWAFCQPCNFKEGEEAEVCFNFIEEEIAEASFWNENKDQKKEIVSSSEKARYYCYGQLESIDPEIINCGPISFKSISRTNDEKAINSYVYFVTSRLDIIKV